jgi:hypothetical protein
LAANGLSLFAPPDGFEIASLRQPEMGIEVPDQVVALRRFSRFTLYVANAMPQSISSIKQ